MLKVLSLCTGIGGADIAAEWAGMEIVGQVEIDKYCNKVLEKYWPNVKRMENIYDVTGNEFGKVDLITAGWPCQPHSVAGKRKGASDKRNLWPEIQRILASVKPRFFVGENVAGLFASDRGYFFGSCIKDLASLGYSVGWCTYGAVDVGAWHRRDRVFIVAYAGSRESRGLSDSIGQAMAEIGQGSQVMADSPECIGFASGTQPDKRDTEGCSENVADTIVKGLAERQEPEIKRGNLRKEGETLAESSDGTISNSGEPDKGGWSAWSRRWGRQSKATCEGGGGGTSPINDIWAVEPNVGRVAHGVPRRVDRLKALGNAVVPQQIYPIYKAIVEIEGEREGDTDVG